ncbi:MAG: hypothetical protein KKE79_02785 [Actinobacteria bacterium]|nr:hypothetical protein [Actinomycetota bacterium]
MAEHKFLDGFLEHAQESSRGTLRNQFTPLKLEKGRDVPGQLQDIKAR